MTIVPIFPELITWAREHRGLSHEQFAARIGVTVAVAIALERGEKQANLTIFRNISKRLRIPGGALLRQTRPNVPALPADFRTHDGKPPVVEFETRIAVDFARTISKNVAELVENNLAAPGPVLPRFDFRRDNPEQAGEAERARLGVTPATQLGWAADYTFKNWRSVIEAAGTFVLLKNFPLAECKGFTVFDVPEAAIIVVSKHERLDVARTFTLVHEYAHLLLRQPGLSDQNDRNPVEAWCNRFTAAFLMPQVVIQQLIGVWPNRPVEWGLADIRNWARKLKVSQQALALRFENLGLATAGFFARIRAQQGVAAAVPNAESEGGDYINIQVNELGDRFTGTVLVAREESGIKSAEAAKILAIRPIYFARVRSQIDKQRLRVGLG